MYTKLACVVDDPQLGYGHAMDSVVTAIGNSRDPDGFRKKYGPKSTDSLTFSIARIMEPDRRKQQQPPITVATSTPAADYFYALESAFKKYVPAAFRSADPAGDNDSSIRLGTPYPMATTAAATVQLFHYQRQQASLPPRSRPPPTPPSRTSQPLLLRSPLPVRMPMPPLPPPSRSTDRSAVAKSARPPVSNEPPPPLLASAAVAPTPSLPPPPPVKTFTCNHCDKVFYAHYNLTRHMPVHTGARPFICKVCTLGYSLVCIRKTDQVRQYQTILIYDTFFLQLN